VNEAIFTVVCRVLPAQLSCPGVRSEQSGAPLLRASFDQHTKERAMSDIVIEALSQTPLDERWITLVEAHAFKGRT
jgi:hypothetical protein